MSYDVIEVKPVPVSVKDIQDEIRNATSDGSKLICLENDTKGNRFLIVTES